MGKYYVNVYDGYFGDNGKVIARVQYNDNLDYWDGRNWTNGGIGRHKGLTKLKDGRYVLINGTDWQGERDFAEIISAEEALQEIMSANHTELLEKRKYKELKELYQQKYAIDPYIIKKYRKSVKRYKDTCTMCGEYCAMKKVSKYLNS